MTPIGRILPQSIDNNYCGHRLALWLFIPIVVMRLGIGSISMFDGYQAAQADSIPLDRFGTAGADAVISMFALLGLLHLVLGSLGVLALIRYRAMIPLIYVLFLIEQLGRKWILLAKPIVRSGTGPGGYVSLVLLALTIAGLVLSLCRPTMRSSELPSAGAAGSRSP